MTPLERILSALADRDCDPKRNGKGWRARCPAHDDRNRRTVLYPTADLQAWLTRQAEAGKGGDR